MHKRGGLRKVAQTEEQRILRGGSGLASRDLLAFSRGRQQMQTAAAVQNPAMTPSAALR